MNVKDILDLVTGTFGRVTTAINAAQPVTTDILDRVNPIVEQGKALVDIGKHLFEGKKPTPEQLAVVEKARHDLAADLSR